MPPDGQRPDREGGNRGGGQVPPTYLPLPSTTREDLRLFRVPPCRKDTLHSQTSMTSPGFEPSPYGIAVSVANHYTGWATHLFGRIGNPSIYIKLFAKEQYCIETKN
ncbi:hypothetical protein TNCV_5138961 [Trichonephila clavipes]|nr:hypothetical protein TNCV_5138961 [Trichonephila clavipes]